MLKTITVIPEAERDSTLCHIANHLHEIPNAGLVDALWWKTNDPTRIEELDEFWIFGTVKGDEAHAFAVRIIPEDLSPELRGYLYANALDQSFGDLERESAYQFPFKFLSHIRPILAQHGINSINEYTLNPITREIHNPLPLN